jgi:anti-sigma B factor antagonist/stage II sporulation protein AA (anti-sigma F factor antagonist)
MSLVISVSLRPWKDGKQMAKLGLDGTLDTATAPQLEKELAAVFEGPTQVLVFDLGKLSFLSSGGVRVMLAARKRVLERSGSCVMLKVQPRIEKTFEIIKALDGLMLFKDDAALDAFLEAMQNPAAA